MKTEVELRECAKKYPTSALYGMGTTNLSKIPFDKIAKELKEDEEALIAFPSGAGSVGKTALQFIAVAITNKRLLVSGKPNSVFGTFMDAGVRSIKLDKVNSVGTNGLTVRIDTIGDEDCMFANYSPEVRAALSKEIQSIIDKYHENKATPASQTIINQKSSAEQIKEYKSLLDDGIITQAEFDEKKKQLLGL